MPRKIAHTFLFVLLGVVAVQNIQAYQQARCNGSPCGAQRALLEDKTKKIILGGPDGQLCEEKVLMPAAAVRIWLFTTISCDVTDAWVMFEHWYHHYLSWGYEKKKFLIAVHRNSTGPESELQCQQITTFLEQERIWYTHWNETFSAAANVKVYLLALKEKVRSAFDWVAYADSDEFHDYGSDRFNTVEEFVLWMEDNKYDAARGSFRDHLNPEGALTKLSKRPSLWEQFPTECDLIGSKVVHGREQKVMVSRAWFRTGNGNHDVIALDIADWYFGPTPPGRTSPRNENYGSEDLRRYTPYYMYNGCYVNKKFPVRPNDVSLNLGFTYFNGKPRIFSEDNLIVHHFKWHEAVIAGARARFHHYAGDMYNNGTWNWDAKPRSTIYYQYSILYFALKKNRTIPLQNATCWGTSESSKRMLAKIANQDLQLQ